MYDFVSHFKIFIMDAYVYYMYFWMLKLLWLYIQWLGPRFNEYW